MNAIRRTDQGGSVATFIIIGVILALGLIGTVYVLKQHGEQVRKEQAIADSERQQDNKKETTKSEDTDKSDAVNSDEIKPPDTSTEATDTSEKLPTTGPELAIGELVGIYLLTIMTTSYMLSRRNQTHHL